MLLVFSNLNSTLFFFLLASNKINRFDIILPDFLMVEIMYFTVSVFI